MVALQAKLQAEAKDRDKELRARFPADQCIACGTKDQKILRLAEFCWRKQESTGEDGIIFSAEHRNIHFLCVDCLAKLHRQRRWAGPVRLIGQISLAAADVGLMASALFLYLMWHSTRRIDVITRLLVPSGLLLLAALFMRARSRRFSVPAPLLDMTRRGWQCREVFKLPHNYDAG